MRFPFEWRAVPGDVPTNWRDFPVILPRVTLSANQVTEFIGLLPAAVNGLTIPDLLIPGVKIVINGLTIPNVSENHPLARYNDGAYVCHAFFAERDEGVDHFYMVVRPRSQDVDDNVVEEKFEKI